MRTTVEIRHMMAGHAMECDHSVRYLSLIQSEMRSCWWILSRGSARSDPFFKGWGISECCRDHRLQGKRQKQAVCCSDLDEK